MIVACYLASSRNIDSRIDIHFIHCHEVELDQCPLDRCGPLVVPDVVSRYDPTTKPPEYNYVQRWLCGLPRSSYLRCLDGVASGYAIDPAFELVAGYKVIQRLVVSPFGSLAISRATSGHVELDSSQANIHTLHKLLRRLEPLN
jgi:hypothetical protein